MLNGLYNIRIRKIYLIRMHITLHRSGSVLLSYNRIHFRGKAPPPRYLSVYRYNCNPIRLIPLPRDQQQQQHSQRPNGKEAALLMAVILHGSKTKRKLQNYSLRNERGGVGKTDKQLD